MIAAGRSLAEAVDDPDPLVRRTARQNLIQLANGSDLGENAQAWRDYWYIVDGAGKVDSQLPAEILDGLDHAQWPVRREALRAVAGVSDQLPASQRGEVAARLTPLVADARPELQLAAEDTLIALAHGYNVSGGETGDPLPAPQTEDLWREYWQQYQRELAEEPRAESLFLMARKLEESGRTHLAAKRFRQIVDEYPDTTAAARSRRRLHPVP
jgi:hypothetical protein